MRCWHDSCGRLTESPAWGREPTCILHDFNLKVIQ